MTTKRKNQLHHFRERMKLRLGETISKGQYENLVNIIKSGQSTFVERQSNRVSVHDVHFNGREIRVVYDNNRKALVTVFKEEWK